MRNGSALNFLLNDHLGSTSVMLKSNGGFWGELRYAAWGETRYTQGTIVTDRQYTGQLNDGDTGLYYYNARYYDPALHKFIQADTIVPDPADPQTLNRYAYVNNNPLRYNDPTGHYPCAFCDLSIEPTGGNYAGSQMADYSDVGPGASSVQGSMNFNASRIQSPISCKFCDEVLSGEIFYWGKPAALPGGGRANIAADGAGGEGGGGRAGSSSFPDGMPQPLKDEVLAQLPLMKQSRPTRSVLYDENTGSFSIEDAVRGDDVGAGFSPLIRQNAPPRNMAEHGNGIYGCAECNALNRALQRDAEYGSNLHIYTFRL